MRASLPGAAEGEGSIRDGRWHLRQRDRGHGARHHLAGLHAQPRGVHSLLHEAASDAAATHPQGQADTRARSGDSLRLFVARSHLSDRFFSFVCAQGHNSFLYTLAGKISVGTPNASKLIDAHNTVTLTNNGKEDGITVTTFDEPADFVFLAAKPIGEPVVQHGPFVLNDRQGVMEAIMDFQSGKNGFEKAPGWRSEIGRPITDHMHDHDDDE